MKSTQKISNKDGILLHVEDYGKGTPVILIHGWPLSNKSWEKQIPALVESGFRVIVSDRRGFGQSESSWDKYDYDNLTDDLNQIITTLNLTNISLIGFSMGGGEVVRYLTKYGSDNISKIALISSIIPLVKQKDDNPDGVPQEKLNEIKTALQNDRLAFLTGFHQGFYIFEVNKDKVSQEQLNFDFSISSHASPEATLKAALSWMDTDFREEVKSISVPTLIIHGDADQTVPIKTAGEQAAALIKNNRYKIYKNAPHGLNITHAEQLNKDLLDFLNE